MMPQHLAEPINHHVSMRTIAILGAGITGLTAAWRLHQAGARVRLFDKALRVGGAVGSETADGTWLIEAGPNSVQESPVLAAVIQELGLAEERLAANPAAKKRFLVRGGRVIAAPSAPPTLIGSPLFSAGAKLRLMAELFRRPRVRTTDVALSDFIGAHFGREFVDYALDPFVAGIYAGNPARLSTRHAFPKLWEIEQRHGSLIRGFIAGARERKATGQPGVPPIVSFRRGLQTLPDALAATLPAGSISLGAQVEALMPGPSWGVVWRGADGTTQTETVDAVVLACPAGALSRLPIGSLGERPLAPLEAMEYPPVASLFLGYRREQVAHPLDGFGVLIPGVERRAPLGVLFSSSLFPGRAPDGHVALTVMVGGARRPDLAGLDIDALTAAVAPDLKDLLGVSGAPVFRRLHTWPRAIPQYNLGHERFAECMSRTEAAHPGLHIGGNFRDGIALPACVAAGDRLAKAALA